VLSLARADVRVVRCCADPAAINSLTFPEGWRQLRVARDETLLLAATADFELLLSEVLSDLTAHASDALAVDHTDAFTVTRMSGQFREAWKRLSAIDMPNTGECQGLIADVPAKALVSSDHVDLLTSSTYEEHVRTRILAACADLDVADSVTVVEVH
jgi:hypothetical protein